jgi:hypothetical protein
LDSSRPHHDGITPPVREKVLLLRYSRITGKPEVILLRRESAPVHLILRLNILGALGDT